MTPEQEARLALVEQGSGVELLPHQREAVQDAARQASAGLFPRLCLYHRTGAGKTLSALAAVAVAGFTEALVLAPPITHQAWQAAGEKAGVQVTAISHAKFRMKSFKVRRTQALIVDEFHLLGGQTAAGWTKLDRIAPGLQAPLIIASATPNYNDAERVYCIMHVLDPARYSGGFLAFLYRECLTKENPFSKIPHVTGFKHFTDAEEYLVAQPKVHYVEDEAIKQITIEDIEVAVPIPKEFNDYGWNHRLQRITASLMEHRQAERRMQILDDDSRLRKDVLDQILAVLDSLDEGKRLMVFSARSTFAMGIHEALLHCDVDSTLIHGSLTRGAKSRALESFLETDSRVIIGTASLSTGADGLDKICDTLLIVDDTDDDALRRQLIGRILPRGLDDDLTEKKVLRLKYV